MKPHSKHTLIVSHTARISAFAALGAAASLFVAAEAGAQPQPTINSQETTVEMSSAPAGNQPSRNFVTANAAGMVVVVDRDTGKMRGLTAEEAGRLAAGIQSLLSQSTDGLVQVRHADGSVSMDLQGRFQSVLLAKKEDDGSITQACVDTPELAAAFFDIDPALVGSLLRGVTRSSSRLLETR